MSNAVTLNPNLPADLVEAAEEAVADKVEAADQVLRIRVQVDHSPSNGPEFYTTVTARYADGTTASVDLHGTGFHDELVELRDHKEGQGLPLRPFSILLKSASAVAS